MCAIACASAHLTLACLVCEFEFHWHGQVYDKDCAQTEIMGCLRHGHSPSDHERTRLNLGRTMAEIKHLQGGLVRAHRQCFKHAKAIACKLGDLAKPQSKKTNKCVFGATTRPQIKGLFAASVLEANKRHAQPGDFRCVPSRAE